MKPILVYITTKNEEEAKTIATALLNDKLISCANIIPTITSMYHWEGSLEQDTETLLLVKTFENNYNKIEAAVKKHHSYDVPCIISLPITQGNKEYLQWSTNECT